MIQYRRSQLSFADGLIAEEVTDLWEPRMRHADEAIDEDPPREIVPAALSQRCKKSKTRGRPGASAEVMLRLQQRVVSIAQEKKVIQGRKLRDR